MIWKTTSALFLSTLKICIFRIWNKLRRCLPHFNDPDLPPKKYLTCTSARDFHLYTCATSRRKWFTGPRASRRGPVPPWSSSSSKTADYRFKHTATQLRHVASKANPLKTFPEFRLREGGERTRKGMRRGLYISRE